MSSIFITEQHDICDGEAKVLRTKQSKLVWQLRFYVKNEGKYFRKSLREKDLAKAQVKARQIFYQIMGRIDAGDKIFSITAKELVEGFLEHQNHRVSGGFITAERRRIVETYSKHFLDFVGENTKLDSIPREKYKEYYSFRKVENPAIAHTTLINEKTAIGSFYKWGLEKGFVVYTQLPLWSEIVRTHGHRNVFTKEQYRTLWTYINKWHKNVNDEASIYNRKMVRDFILILANTGMRFGEARQILWQNVEVKKGENKYPNVHITIPLEISKSGKRTGKERTAIGMRGDIFTRIKTYSPYTTQNDFVFTEFGSREAIRINTLRKLWKTIRAKSGISGDFTYYCLRHTFATNRLMYGKIDVYTLSKIMGCAVSQIEHQYGNIKTTEMTDYIPRREDDFGIFGFDG